MTGAPLAADTSVWQRVRRLRSTSRYRRARRTFLAANPWCRECERHGLSTPAAELDHVVPAVVAPDRFWDRTNWQPLCRPCHAAKSATERDELGIGPTSERTPERRAFDELLGGPPRRRWR